MWHAGRLVPAVAVSIVAVVPAVETALAVGVETRWRQRDAL